MWFALSTEDDVEMLSIVLVECPSRCEYMLSAWKLGSVGDDGESR